MKYEEFTAQVKEGLQRALAGRNAEIQIHEVIKQNDCRKDGITIREEGRMSAPTVYLEDFYEWFLAGAQLEEILRKILEIHDENKDMFPGDMLRMEQFEYAKEHVTCRLLNTAINRQYLKDVPSVQMLDLSLVFYCTIIAGREQHVLSSKISYELMESWGVDTETLYMLALKNTPALLGVYLKEVRDIFLETMGEEGLDRNMALETAINDPMRTPMYILSNIPRNSGAVNMFLGDTVSGLSDRLEDDLYIIPSSIHEVLLIPVSGRLNREEVDDMVKEVNRNVLRPQDLLSDHVYIYSRGEGRIIM